MGGSAIDKSTLRDAQLADLVARAVKGDAVAVTVLLTESYDRLRRFVASRIPHRLQALIDADDVLQDAHVDAYRNLHRFEARGPDSFDRWLGTIALRRLRNQIQRYRAAKRGGGAAAITDAATGDSIVMMLDIMVSPEKSPSRRAARNEAVDAFSAALGLLPEAYRQAVQLVYLDGLPVDEAATRMGRTPSAVRNLCHKAKQRLLTALGSRSLYLSDS